MPSKRRRKNDRPRDNAIRPAGTSSGKRLRYTGIAIATGLAAVVLLIYWQVLGYRFINFDDNVYILDNPPVRAGLTFSGIAWAFTTIRRFYWQPLTWLSHMLDCQLYGLNPAGHHFTNVIFHAANSALLFLVLWRLTGYVYRSGFVAALFALHPLRVESVAWVAERKDVLCAFFCLLSLFLYVRYVERPSRKRYLAVLAAFSCGLMAKPMAVTWPIVLLLVDFWPLRRKESIGARIGEKLPLFFLAAVVSVLTLLAKQETGVLASLDRVPVLSRIGNAFIAYAEYLWKTVWPRNLAILYPFPAHLFTAGVLLSLAVLIAISVVVFAGRQRRPWLVTGWCWFVVMLVPTIGIFQVGGQALADRFTYLPQIGLLLALVWTAAELLSRWKPGRVTAIALAVTILPALGIASWNQTRYWADSVTVSQHAIDVTSENAVMEHNLAYALSQQGRRNEAISHFSRSVAIEPGNYATQYNLGKSLVEDGKPLEAEVHFRESVRLKPDYAEAHFALASVLRRRNATDEAAREFTLALAGPLNAFYSSAAHNNLGVMLAQHARYAEAAAHFAEAARLKPELNSAHMNYARCLVAENRSADAQAYLAGVLQTRGENPYLRRYLNSLKTRVGQDGILRGVGNPAVPKQPH